MLTRAVEAISPADPNSARSIHVAIGARATVHGLATLWLDGALAQFTDEDLFSIALGVLEADVQT